MDQPAEPAEPARPGRLRISDDDRHQVAEALRRAAGDGRLDLDELDQRLESTYSAKIYDDLVPILSDLPDEAPRLPAVAPDPTTARRPASGEVGTAPQYDRTITVMGGASRRGVWEIGATHTAFCLMGGADLDLREAVFAAPEVVITANVVMGGIDVIVDAHTKVIVDGIGIMGDFSQARDRVDPEIGPDSPVVRVKGVALMGAVTVVRKRPRRERRRRHRLH